MNCVSTSSKKTLGSGGDTKRLCLFVLPLNAFTQLDYVLFAPIQRLGVLENLSSINSVNQQRC